MLFDLVDLIANTDSIIVDSSGEGSSSEVEVDEETIIKYYFQREFSYEEIILVLAKHHKPEISYSTLLRRLKAYGLGRRGFFTRDDSHNTIKIVRKRVNGPMYGKSKGLQFIISIHVPGIIGSLIVI